MKPAKLRNTIENKPVLSTFFEMPKENVAKLPKKDKKLDTEQDKTANTTAAKKKELESLLDSPQDKNLTWPSLGF